MVVVETHFSVKLEPQAEQLPGYVRSIAALILRNRAQVGGNLDKDIVNRAVLGLEQQGQENFGEVR